ncbi:MAG: carboxylesterase family protein [Sediminibacterium sp.]
MTYKKICHFFIALFFLSSIASAQNTKTPNPFQPEIDAFAKADKINMPDEGKILFAGSSSFRLWKDVNDYFPGKSILNRGFGGATLLDLIQYSKETIIQYKPKQIFIYCGENDIADNDTVKPKDVLDRFKKLYSILRTQLPATTPIVFLSLKPSIARWSMHERMAASNDLIKNFISTQKNIQFLDVYSKMLDTDGTPFKDIFIEDKLHMNANGYKIWQKLIAPLLISTDKPTANTNAGKVAGFKEGNINVFKGIPFAAPPVGDLRWKAPQPVKPWSGVKDCIQFAASPVQGEPIPFMCWSEEFLIPKKPIDEDCLYLNVWAKNTAAKKPVLVYIYGGGFRSGGAGCAIYDGKEMAEKDVVFVSINYRVGVFGFLAHPELTKESGYGASGNYALLDMIAALKWVKQNIAAFGGDPNQVTIAGQSAGAFAVNHLCATPLAKGLFKGAIAQSGGSVLTSTLRPTTSLQQAENMGIDFAKHFKVSSIQDLRKISAEDILKSNQGLSYPIEDGYVLPSSIADIYSNGKQNDIALMLGWNLDDKVTGPPVNAEAYKQQLQKQFGTNAEKVLQYYPATNDAIAATSQDNLSRDGFFGVQGYAWANAQLHKGKSKIFIYNFNRKLPAYSAASNFGAFHTGEVPYVFNNLKTVNRPWEDIDIQLADQLSSYWANFVKTGNPNGGNLTHWPSYTTEKDQVLVIDQQTNATKMPFKDGLRILSTLY